MKKIEFEFTIYDDVDGLNILGWRKDYIKAEEKTGEFIGFKLNEPDGLKFVNTDKVKYYKEFGDEELAIHYTGKIKIELDGADIRNMYRDEREKLKDIIELIAEYYIYPECEIVKNKYQKKGEK